MKAKGLGCLVLSAAALMAMLPASAPAATGGKMRATITRTKYGVPHIRSRTWQGLGFGYAYAFAEDNICTIADSYVTVSAERSRYFGPDETWKFSGNGAVNKNIDSDFFYARINESGIVEDLISRPPPEGPAPELKKIVHGYVAGYNAYLRDTGVDNIPDKRCRGADWVRPITELDVYRRFHQLGSLASSGAAITGIGAAAPAIPAPRVAKAERAQDRSVDELANGGADGFFPLDSGSNAIGLGSEATKSGAGMVLGNPHFPWDGAERLYQAQLTIPGKLDVTGGSLYGVPAVLIGQNRYLAWSHTVASAWRFTPFQLTLVPGDPHSYLVDGQPRAMKPVDLTVKALATDGSLEDRTRTLYETEYGPMFTSILGLPLFPWTPTMGFALGDANYENFRYLNHFLETDRARSVRAYDRIERRIQGIPWVNSIAADRKGHAYYTMDGAIPNVPDEKATNCSGALGLTVFPLTGIPILDGSRSACNWDTDPDAVVPGIFGPAAIPRLFRRDYVENGNDSHWLANPEQPLTGYDRVIGDEQTTRSLRTRLGLTMIQERIAGTDGLPGKGFTLRKLAKVALGNRQYAGELWRDELVAFCEQNPTLAGSSGPVDVSGACPVLAGWDVHDNLDSAGAILFRRFASRLLGNFTSLPTGVSSGYAEGSEAIFDVPFSASDPVNTPRGLNTDNAAVGKALADAVTDLDGAGIPLDGTLRDFQYETRGGKKIPIHGGPGTLGVFNAINVSWDPHAGYPNVPHGSSFIAAMTWAKHGCPVRELSFVTYSESENQSSPHAADYTKAFSKKRWNKVPFCARDVRAQAINRERVPSR
ncbi:MAG: acyl-homoserine-lactone acylase [Solirubrobacterales bacterium]|jgi:acyl-homoserine-lactone acylase|nr:acyl-homoserine-lactone acylase [Solirubrobacterales bacterium]